MTDSIHLRLIHHQTPSSSNKSVNVFANNTLLTAYLAVSFIFRVLLFSFTSALVRQEAEATESLAEDLSLRSHGMSLSLS